MESTELLGYRRLLKRKNCSDHTVRNYLNILTRFSAWLWVSSIEFLNPQDHPFGDSTEGAKGFPQSHLLADSLDLLNDFLPDPVQKIHIRRISNILGLRSGIRGNLLRFDQAPLPPSPQQHGFNLLHPFGAQAVAELDETGGFQKDTGLKGFKSTKALPIGIFVKFFDRPLIRAVESVLQDMQPDHEANGLSRSAQGAVVFREGLLQTVPIDQLRRPQELMVWI